MRQQEKHIYKIDSTYMTLEPIRVHYGYSEFTKKRIVQDYFRPLRLEFSKEQIQDYSKFVIDGNKITAKTRRHMLNLDKQNGDVNLGLFNYLHIYFVFFNIAEHTLELHKSIWDLQYGLISVQVPSTDSIIISGGFSNEVNEEEAKTIIDYYNKFCEQLHADLEIFCTSPPDLLAIWNPPVLTKEQIMEERKKLFEWLTRQEQ